MSIRRGLFGIWLMAMTLLSLGAFTTYYVAQMRLTILQDAYLALCVLQLTTLLIYLWGPEKLKFRPLKALYHLFFASSLFVIPAFVFIFFALVSQYHTRIPESINAENMDPGDILPGEETQIYNTGSLYIFFPEYSNIELVCKDRPSKRDTSVTWCCGAAFQHTVSLGFSQINVEGDHAVSGAYYESPYNKDSFAAFTYANNEFSFEFTEPTLAIKKAAEAGGSGFMQFGLIHDGEVVMDFKMPRTRCFRTLAELNGNVCIIDSVNMMHFDDFLAELRDLGVTNAVYMDMGAGWNYSWYRRASGKVKTLFGLPVPWSHNWIVFKS
ncbi:hypothetical protein [Butyrivibrio sp. MC2021]|uniref:hypothetical protein n=1 Tax=Butyrivibrio sp. MC2021 TaxID=1408306 RepID=UPI00047EBA8F|nr:hypothetical protein [Butyrivibrio sp. MC2021]